MPEKNAMHPIYFDSAESGDFTDVGLPYRVFEPDAGLDMMLAVHISGVFQYRIVNGTLLETFPEAEGFLRRNLINSLPGVLADSEGGFGLPRELPAHAKEIGDALVSRLSWTWTDRYGVVLEQLAITDCRLTPQSKALLERSLGARKEDDALRTRLGLERRQKPQQQRPQQQTHTTDPQRPQQQTHTHQEELQQVVSKLVSSWQSALEKTKSGAIPTSPPGAQTGAAPTWRCPRCGRYNHARFCSNCGERRVWICPRCGRRNSGNFCMMCGQKEP